MTIIIGHKFAFNNGIGISLFSDRLSTKITISDAKFKQKEKERHAEIESAEERKVPPSTLYKYLRPEDGLIGMCHYYSKSLILMLRPLFREGHRSETNRCINWIHR